MTCQLSATQPISNGVGARAGSESVTDHVSRPNRHVGVPAERLNAIHSSNSGRGGDVKAKVSKPPSHLNATNDSVGIEAGTSGGSSTGTIGGNVKAIESVHDVRLVSSSTPPPSPLSKPSPLSEPSAPQGQGQGQSQGQNRGHSGSKLPSSRIKVHGEPAAPPPPGLTTAAASKGKAATSLGDTGEALGENGGVLLDKGGHLNGTQPISGGHGEGGLGGKGGALGDNGGVSLDRGSQLSGTQPISGDDGGGRLDGGAGGHSGLGGGDLTVGREELAAAIDAALAGLDAEAALRWHRIESRALREVAAHHAAAADRHETLAAARDTLFRQRLRKLGLWRLMDRLGLEVRVSVPTLTALQQWLHICRGRIRKDGRGGLDVTGFSPSTKCRTAATSSRDGKVTAGEGGKKGIKAGTLLDDGHQLSTTLPIRSGAGGGYSGGGGDDEDPDSDSDDGEPGLHRWRDRGPERIKQRGGRDKGHRQGNYGGGGGERERDIGGEGGRGKTEGIGGGESAGEAGGGGSRGTPSRRELSYGVGDDDRSSLWSRSQSSGSERGSPAAARRTPGDGNTEDGNGDDDDGDESVMSYSTLASTVQTGSDAGDDDVHGGRIMRLMRPPPKGQVDSRSYSTVPRAAPGLRASDLAKLAKELRESNPRTQSSPGKDNAAVLEWQSEAAAASDALKATLQRTEDELLGVQISQRNERTSRRAAEEDLQREIDALRDKVRGKEADWSERLATESAGRQLAEGELRALQATTRVKESESMAGIEAVRAEAAAEARVREARLIAEVEALRAETEERQAEWRRKAEREAATATAASAARDVAEGELRALQESTRVDARTRAVAANDADVASFAIAVARGRRETELAAEVAQLRLDAAEHEASLRSKLSAEAAARAKVETSARATAEEQQHAQVVLEAALAAARKDRATLEGDLRDLQGTVRCRSLKP